MNSQDEYFSRRSFLTGLLATSPDYPALCGGAFITGETAAREVIATTA
jgi:hypothetical protein